MTSDRTSNLLYPDVVGHGPLHRLEKRAVTAGERAAMTAERAKIANGFSHSATAHWGKTKAKIREILLPRANQLLSTRKRPTLAR
jgi:hypothetical protein